MPDFKDWKSVEKYLKNCIDSALEVEVAQIVKQVEQDVIEEEVYNAYTPKYYERRGAFGGGIGDVSNMYSRVDNGVLTVTNITPPNPNYNHSELKSKHIAYAVEYGMDYDYFNPGARPFTQKTVDTLERTKEHEKAMRRGLKRQGLKTD